MYPGMMFWWKQTQRQSEHRATAGCGAGAGRWTEMHASSEACGDSGSGGFGVRRPLRFLAYKLELSDSQVAELARIINDLKTERAQADVDSRRAVAAFADAVAGSAFEQGRAQEGAALRVQSAERLRDALVKALGSIHAILNEEQRARLGYLIRTGALAL